MHRSRILRRLGRLNCWHPIPVEKPGKPSNPPIRGPVLTNGPRPSPQARPAGCFTAPGGDSLILTSGRLPLFELAAIREKPGRRWMTGSRVIGPVRVIWDSVRPRMEICSRWVPRLTTFHRAQRLIGPCVAALTAAPPGPCKTWCTAGWGARLNVTRSGLLPGVRFTPPVRRERTRERADGCGWCARVLTAGQPGGRWIHSGPRLQAG